MNDRLRDFVQVSKKAIIDSFKKFKKVYIAFIFVLLRSFFKNYRFAAIFGGNMISGLIDYFIDVILLCFIVQCFRSIVLYGNSGKKSLDNSINNFFQALLSSFFFVYLISTILRMVFVMLPREFYILVMAVFEFLMSALLEEIYINEKSGFDAVKSSAQFVCDNILIYGLYALIFIFIEVYLNYDFSFNMIFGAKKIGTILLIAIAQTFFYLIRGHLFKQLNNHSYRQRKFMRG